MLLSVLLTVVGAYLLVVVLAFVFQRKMMYLPGWGSAPEARTYLGNGEDVTLETGDGLRLGAWYLPATRPDGVTVVLFNGNAGDRSIRAPLGAAIASAGHGVLLTDYRGYGGNPGSPSETGLIADGLAARAWLDRREEVDPDRIVYLGESLGAAVAVAVAVERPPAGLILRSPFTSAVDAGKAHYPFLPVGLLLRDRFPSIERIENVSCPLLVIAGESDRIVPAGLSRRLYEAAPGPKRLVVFPGVDHNDLEFLDGPRFLEEVLRFLDEL
jgi:fermentation-respiration switch protein FrsA (DUF1100 family)